MKAENLRLGNLVLHNGKIVKVVGIEEKHINILKDPVQCYFHTVPINGLEPIELTEEVILSIRYQGTFWRSNNNTEITIYNNYDEYPFLFKDLKYLHILQNIHYFLTEKELNYETN